jgi:hypothetical protein
MRSFAAAALVAASIATQASATIFTTNPVASTTCTAGQPCTVSWNDDGTTPALGTIGACSIDLCTGGQQQQTCLQNISPSTAVSTVATVSFLPNANDGPDGAYYFIKYTALSYMDPTNPTFPFTAYSAKFTLAGMTGTFNSTIMNEISGAATVAAATTAAAGASNATPSFLAAATSKVVTVTSKASSAASATTTAKKSGAASVTVPGVVSSVAGVAVAMGFASAFLGAVAFGL